ncbi:hypothetical protein [Reichenbachiella sp. 5M10]|uniref:hypothetical protein n=1 Tax=Reichenbachiella sp. 5M10 TaxID=1889772 RepID=UPI0013040994|nr:hypothetical protein [Reichenbachiella sp. 5M10]
MKPTLYLFLAILLLSCSNRTGERVDASILNLETSEALNRDQITENDSVVEYLNVSFPYSPITINEVRNDILGRTEQIKQELISNCGGLDEYGNIFSPTEQKIVFDFLVNQGKGKEFQQLANSIVDYSIEQGIPQQRIAQDAQEIAVFKNDPNQAQKTFVGIYFSRANLIEALNAMTTIESYVLQVESVYLNRQLMQIEQNGM